MLRMEKSQENGWKDIGIALGDERKRTGREKGWTPEDSGNGEMAGKISIKAPSSPLPVEQ